MTYILLKKTGKFPKAWKKITTLERLFYNYDFLKEQYGITDETIVKVHRMMNINGFRTAIKQYYAGPFLGFCRKSAKSMKLKAALRKRQG